MRIRWNARMALLYADRKRPAAGILNPYRGLRRDDADARPGFPHPWRIADARRCVRGCCVRVRGDAARDLDRPCAAIGFRSRSGASRRTGVRGELLRRVAVLAVAPELVASLRDRGRVRGPAEPRARVPDAG